jgi:hypothetical protein
MLTPPNQLLLMQDVWLKRLCTVIPTTQDKIEVKFSERNEANLMAPFPRTVDVCSGDRIAKASLIRVRIE